MTASLRPLPRRAIRHLDLIARADGRRRLLWWPLLGLLLLTATLLMAVVAGTTALYPLLIKWTFQWYEARQADTVAFFGFSIARANVIYLLPSLILLATAIKGGALYLQTIATSDISFRIVKAMQKAMFARLTGADLARLARDTTGSLVSRFANDMAVIREALTRAFNNLVRDALTLLALLAAMLYLDWILSLVVLVFYPLIAIPIARLGRNLRKLSTNMQSELGDMTALLSESLSGARMVKTYALEPYETRRSGNVFERLYGILLTQVRQRAWLEPVLESSAGLAVAGILVFAGFRIMDPNSGKSIGDFTGFVTALIMAAQPVRAIGTLNSVVQEGLAAVERVYALLDEAPTIVDAPGAQPLDIRSGRIAFQGVSFNYQGGATALRDVSFEIEPRATTALVGPSGAGKSTIMNLIPRLYDCGTGIISIDDQDVRAVTLASLRKAIALVSQDVVLFNDTVRSNIAFGKLDATLPEIEAAAKAAAAHSFIAALPQGYDTIVGEQGAKLSGGQRQRIAIARAILKDAPILLLDEATSALDSESERQVREALAYLKSGRTTLVIAHRLSTVLDADRIVVLEQGRVVETGSHSELLRKGGLYDRLFKVQFASDAGEPRALQAGA